MDEANLKIWPSQTLLCAKNSHCKFTKAGTLEEYNGRDMKMKASSGLVLFCFTCKHFLFFDKTTYCQKHEFGAPEEILITKECAFWEDMFEDEEED